MISYSSYEALCIRVTRVYASSNARSYTMNCQMIQRLLSIGLVVLDVPAKKELQS